MKFDADRFSHLAGLPSLPERDKKTLSEGSDRQTEGPEVKELRRIIRREAKSLIESMQRRHAAADRRAVDTLQKTQSLTEAVAMGFAGPGFGGMNYTLGGPMTSARQVASLKESDWTMTTDEMIDYLVDAGMKASHLIGLSDEELSDLIAATPDPYLGSDISETDWIVKSWRK